MHEPIKPLIIVVSVFLLLLQISYSQFSTSANQGNVTNQYPVLPESLPDYKVIASTSSYIELEFLPEYNQPEKIRYNNEEFIRLGFTNSASDDMRKSGAPDIGFRVFPVILPSEEGNRIEIIEYDVNEIRGINLAPVPSIQLHDQNRRDFENVKYDYSKNPAAYSQNKMLPENPAALKEIAPVRDIILGKIEIHPYQYNPVTRELKQFTRIRIRVSFGNTPVPVNRKRSQAEYELLKGIALNSEIGLSWMNPKVLGPKSSLVSNSVMNTGDWYKIEIRDNGNGSSSGIYKITKSFLESAGINLSGVDPRTIKMYGNGGELLPENMAAGRPSDLTEIAILIQGEEDGHFDAQDYILFYGKSVNSWVTDQGAGGFRHYINYYSKSNYYWIRLNTTGFGKRMQTIISANISNPVIPSSFTECLFNEPEENNLIMEGNLWLSGRFSSGQSYSWNNTLTGLESSSDIIYKIKPACHVYSGTYNYMLLKEEYSNMSPVIFQMSYSTGNYGNWIWTDATSFTINQSQKTNGEQSKFTAEYHCSNPDAEAYIDWMEILYKRRFNSVTNDFTHFRSPAELQGVIEYNISPFSNNQIKIFDITAHDGVSIVQPISTGSNSIRFQRQQNLVINEYFVVGQNGYKTPASISQRIPNQNLHGGFNNGASFVIITHKDLIQAANRLKEKRENPGAGNPLKTLVFDVDQIYNEFSGGLLDVTAIRDFLKYCYENWQEKPAYVCLFGDGSIDYRSILTQNSNRVPPYENTSPLINEVNGYCSDDFFTNVVQDTYEIPDIAVGRIPAYNPEDANYYLDKISCYEDPSMNGNWKNKIAFVADDGTTTSGPESSIHTDQSEMLAESYTPAYIDKIKLYLVAYPTVITSQGRRKPGVNRDIIKYWNEGLIAINYVGHGSPEVWAHEYVFEKNTAISQLNNNCRYPFLTVASCDFSKFDNPLNISGGELMVISPRKGSIVSLGATRPVYSGNNAVLNNMFWTQTFIPRDTMLLQNRFGKALFTTKHLIEYGLNEKKFVLLGDPTQRVQYPRYLSRIDTIEGLHGDTMKALSKIIIRGSVLRPDNSLWDNYNGNTKTKIFDVIRVIRMTDENGILFVFRLPGGLIYSGSSSIRNGKWKTEFIVPKDISFLNKHGWMLNYFYNTSADGSGLDTSFIIGGMNYNAAVDSVGPDIKMFLNTRNFRSGDVVNPNFKLIADLFDESGINTTGTIGHKIEAVMDNNENNKYDLTNFYNSDTTYKSGSLEYDFYDVAEGKHILRLKAWDTYNNSSEAQIEFNVSSSSALRISNVFNYPNPFKDNTSFTFQHNYSGAINVSIKIYTVSGRLIKKIEKNSVNDKFVVIDWPGTDEDGEKLANGVYIYKLNITADNGTSETTLGKLAVLK